MDFYNRHILIAGMDDFLGSHFVEALISAGAHVRIWACPSSDKKTERWRNHLPAGNVKVIPCLETQVGVPINGIYDAVQGMDIVYQLEGFSPVKGPATEEGRVRYRYTRYMRSLDLLLACREAGVMRVVRVVGSHADGLDHPEKPVEAGDLYDLNIINESIRCDVEELSKNFVSVFGLPLVMVHAHNIYGPWQDGRETIPALIHKILRATKPILLKGQVAEIDYVHVSDVVQGLLLAGCQPGLNGTSVALGGAEKVSQAELASRIAAILGREIKVVLNGGEFKERRLLENEGTDRDDPLPVQLPGWKAQIDLHEGLKRTIEWMKVSLPHPAGRG